MEYPTYNYISYFYALILRIYLGFSIPKISGLRVVDRCK